ncbi:MAG: hypothetical protein JWO63_2902 [Frankiales bacterium]|jgi:hypothetical protein|nr:hypothetical protein [Frankiales bacterium]
MALTTIITDDLDGSSGADTLTFAIEGTEYIIDLSKKNRTAFEKALKPFIDAARPSRPASRSRRSPTKSAPVKKTAKSRATVKSSLDLKAIRAWAVENGLTISDRGRIAADIVESYQAAHQN